ncbi:unnamed protein product [Cyclocybe aegerita]|uniref:Uncharacterized protein n=1 Tax=Cyclocybe aegerita TaxID=1973307 RepID=A0A8S0W5P6_CYCAE|nr:unnamed protein product [Cyclocybe aegerita]
MATNPTISLDSAVDLLTSALQDPAKTNVCAVGLGLAADRINIALEGCTTIAARIKIVKAYPQLLRAGIKFLTFNQPLPGHVAMVNHLNTCRCDLWCSTAKRNHQPSRPRPDGQVKVHNIDLLFDAVIAVSNCLILALSDRTQHKFDTGNVDNGEKHWPQGPDDLLPKGPKDAVLGLELWVANVSYGDVIFKLAGCLALFYDPFAREVLQYLHFRFTLARPFGHLEHAIKFYNEGDPSPLARTLFFQYSVTTIFDFFDNLISCDTVRFNILLMARGREVGASPVLARLTTISSTLPPQEWRKTCRLVHFMGAYINADMDPTTGVRLVKFE